LADSAITGGVALLLLDGFKKPKWVLVILFIWVSFGFYKKAANRRLF
jgi:hypothetical protein